MCHPSRIDVAGTRTLKEDECELVIERIVQLCTPKVLAMQRPRITRKQKRVALVTSEEMGGLSGRGSMAEISSLIYEHREFAISTFGLEKGLVYSAIEASCELVGPGSLQCTKCSINDFDTSNPIILCDGCNSAYHISCVDLEDMPHNDWLCVKCVEDGLFLIESVLDRRVRQHRTEYLIRWVANQGEDNNERETWQAVADLPKGPGSRCMEKIAAFNAQQRV